MLKLFDTDVIQNIANAIREKTGKSDKLKLDEMASEIENIESGGGSLDETLLWENNSSKTVSSLATDINSQTLLEYTYIKLVYKYDNRYTPSSSVICNTDDVIAKGLSFGDKDYYRTLHVENDVLIFWFGFSAGKNASPKTSYANSNKEIPYQIYGLGKRG